jgi:hypothetical protein
MLLQPLLLIFSKSSIAAMQTVLHTLFLPTPFKVLSQSTTGANAENPKDAKGSIIESSVTEMPEEVLKPGALYADCAVVRLKVPLPSSASEQLASEKRNAKHADGEKGKSRGNLAEEALEIPDDGEFGGEVTGRLVWEAYEEALKGWEKTLPADEKTEVAPDVDDS